MSLTTVHPADTDAPILDVLAERWSTRIFDAQTPIDEEALASELEAARWAPSANNTQPWRFVVARRGTGAHAAIVAALMGFNQTWAADAGALGVLENLLKAAGFDVHRVTFSEPGTADIDNLYARIGSSAPHITFAGHTDVVPTGPLEAWQQAPFNAHVDADGMLRGRGAKAGCAAGDSVFAGFIFGRRLVGVISAEVLYLAFSLSESRFWLEE